MAAANPSFSPNPMLGQLPVQGSSQFPGQFPGQAPGQGQGQSIQLHDIHLPEQVSDFPIAPGWWILIAVIVFTALWFYKKHKQKQQLNAIKKQALTVLANNQALSAKECITLLKSAAMHYFSRYDIAKLYGEGFQTFLVTQLPDKYQNKFISLSTAGFQAQYQAGNNQVVNTVVNASEDSEVKIEKSATVNTTKNSVGSLANVANENNVANVDNVNNVNNDFYQAAKLWLTHALPRNKSKELSE